MNNEMAYLLGMITGNGEVQRGATETTIGPMSRFSTS